MRRAILIACFTASLLLAALMGFSFYRPIIFGPFPSAVAGQTQKAHYRFRFSKEGLGYPFVRVERGAFGWLGVNPLSVDLWEWSYHELLNVYSTSGIMWVPFRRNIVGVWFKLWPLLVLLMIYPATALIVELVRQRRRRSRNACLHCG